MQKKRSRRKKPRTVVNPLSLAEATRRRKRPQLQDNRQAELGQFMTPEPVAQLMASMFTFSANPARLLDAGAGFGALSAAWVTQAAKSKRHPSKVEITSFEVDKELIRDLRRTMKACAQNAQRAGIHVSTSVQVADFIEAAATAYQRNLLEGKPLPTFTEAILNPPYKKINSNSHERHLLRTMGIETVNAYAAFLAIAVKLLENGGQLVAIVPRSFCNGPYYRPFRRLLLESMAIQKVHLFERRDRAFREDKVLQENLIIHAVKGAPRNGSVEVTCSTDAEEPPISKTTVPYDVLIDPEDPELFIRLPKELEDSELAATMKELSSTLPSLGLDVSTGRVVDFRAKEYLRKEEGTETVPLIYPCHFNKGEIVWPKEKSKKPNAIMQAPETLDLLIPKGTYVLVKRFSAKEERRRIVAAVYDPRAIPAKDVGFENHLNYFHRGGRGLNPDLARGLAGYLNSSFVDDYFRQFSGHTQVNATDLKTLPYPSEKQLCTLGRTLKGEDGNQNTIDSVVQEVLFTKTKQPVGAA